MHLVLPLKEQLIFLALPLQRPIFIFMIYRRAVGKYENIAVPFAQNWSLHKFIYFFWLFWPFFTVCNLIVPIFFYGTSLFLCAILSFILADSHELLFCSFCLFAFLCIRTQSHIAVFVLFKINDVYLEKFNVVLYLISRFLSQDLYLYNEYL